MHRQFSISFSVALLTLLVMPAFSTADQSALNTQEAVKATADNASNAMDDSASVAADTAPLATGDLDTARSTHSINLQPNAAEPTQDQRAVARANRKKVDSKDDRLTKEAEQSAIQFAQQHHPALGSLVKRLRNRDADAYGKAIRELSTASVRLTRLKERQPQRFQAELDLWKVDSEIRLQLARWAVSGSDRLESTLRGLLTKRQKLRRQRLAVERERLESRMKMIDEQLKAKKPQLKEDIEREWTKLTRRLRPMNDKAPARKKASKDGSKPDSEKPKSDKEEAAKPAGSDVKSENAKTAI